jgi:uncharacterized membrane protein YccF (DUF307 family)
MAGTAARSRGHKDVMAQPNSVPTGSSTPPSPPTQVARIPTIPDSRPRGEPGFLVRAVWFIFIGWWLSALAVGVAYFLCAIIVGLPLAFMIFNQLPAILTLRPRTADPTGVPVEQYPLWIRAVWFLLVGWWLGAFYMSVAWGLCVILITLPIGLWLFNRVGAVMTLLRY